MPRSWSAKRRPLAARPASAGAYGNRGENVAYAGVALSGVFGTCRPIEAADRSAEFAIVKYVLDVAMKVFDAKSATKLRLRRNVSNS